METAIVGIHFVVTDQHFDNGKLKVSSIATKIIGKGFQNLIPYAASLQRSTAWCLLEDYWKDYLGSWSLGKYGGGSTNGNHVRPDEVYDQYTLHEDEQFHSKKNSYLTQLQGKLEIPISFHIHKDSLREKTNSLTIRRTKSIWPAFFYFLLDLFFHFVSSGEEDDGTEGLEEGGAAWRGASSGSSQSVALSGATATMLTLLSWSLARQLVSRLVATTMPGKLPMRDATSQKEQQLHQRQSLRVTRCNSNNSSSSKKCSGCIRQLTWFNCHATLVPHFRDGNAGREANIET